ncbi:PREDICTED: uncharacterized protein LOC104808924 [Tarenaya hassleriana]|uniref:uncharacterized protein LOC104808924 n=1 Tax=Tarenaya hassleriana TaxID=28532 RepID=UPI00053C499C|nr:PREDICTED: uncharacterized protein LOC104808924 [Tarenaya hassleriana]
MATGAADGMFRSIFEGCISGCDAAIERRPYHKNCRCALHERSRGGGGGLGGKNQNQRRICRHGRSESVAFPIRRSWSEGNVLALHLASSSSSSNLQSLSSSSSLSNLASASESPSDSPVAAETAGSRQLRWTIDEEDDEKRSAQGLEY